MNWRYVYFVLPLEYFVKKSPVYTKRANNHFNYGQIMQCIITYTTGIRSYLKPVLRCKFVILDTYHPDTLYYVSNYARIRGYFSKPEGAREQESFEKHCSK